MAMAIEIKFSGKNDRVGRCFVTVGGVAIETSEGSNGMIEALMEIDAFEKTVADKTALRDAFEELARKSNDEFHLVLSELAKTDGVSADANRPAPYRYVADLDGERIYSGNSLFDLQIEISNVPEPSVGP